MQKVRKTKGIHGKRKQERRCLIGCGPVAVGAASTAQPAGPQPVTTMPETIKKFPPDYNALLRGRRLGVWQGVHANHGDRKPRSFFRDIFLGRLAIREMMRLEKEGQVHSLAFVLMPDHLHWLLVLQENSDLSRVVTLLKGCGPEV